DRGIERARMPGDRDRHVAQIGKGVNARILPHHDRAGAHRGAKPDDLASAQPLHALDRAPFPYRIDPHPALLKLLLLPPMGEILLRALGAFGIVLVIDDVEAFFGEEALLDRYPPGTVMGIAVALETDGARHGRSAGLIQGSRNHVMPPISCDHNGARGWQRHASPFVPVVAPFVPRIHHYASANQMELRWRGFGVAGFGWSRWSRSSWPMARRPLFASTAT